MIKKINVYKRKIVRYLTTNLGTNSYLPLESDSESIKKILIIRPNHRLGNILLITPLVEEILVHFPDAKIDFFVKGKIAEIIFENHPNVDEVFYLPKKHFKEFSVYIMAWNQLITKKKYDFVINTNHGSSSGQLATKWAKAWYKFFGLETNLTFKKLEDYHHFAKFPIYNFRAYLLKSFPDLVFAEIPKLRLVLTEQEIENAKKILNGITTNDKKTITFFTFATGDKCFSKEFWAEMYSKLVLNFGDEYNLLEILPVENVSQIDFKGLNFYSKDIREITAVLKNSELFIGADSGIMHLAATSTTTFGLFSTTPREKYQPFGEFNLGINMNETSVDDFIEMLKNFLPQK